MKYLRSSVAFLSLFLASILPSLVFADTGGDPTRLPNPLANNVTSIYDFVQAVLGNIVLPIGSIVVVFFIIYAGYLFVTAGGNESQLEKAKHTLLWVLVGAAILLGSWAIALAVKGTLCQIAPMLFECH